MGEYLCEYCPSHHMSTKEGYVYTHVLQAEKILNRELKKGECVHHIDKDKYNNDLSNLMVFKTIADHTSFHSGKKAVLDNDVYICPQKAINDKIICPICNTNTMWYASNMCILCRNEKYRSSSKLKTNRLSKEELLELIKKYSFVKIGKIYGVSDNTIRKWCRYYELPYRRKDINNLL